MWILDRLDLQVSILILKPKTSGSLVAIQADITNSKMEFMAGNTVNIRQIGHTHISLDTT